MFWLNGAPEVRQASLTTCVLTCKCNKQKVVNMLLILQVYCKYILIIHTCTKSAGPMQKHLYQNFIQKSQCNARHAVCFVTVFQVGCNTDHHSWQPDSSFMQIDNELHFCSCKTFPTRFPNHAQPFMGKRERERASAEG